MNVRDQLLLNKFYICLGIGERERKRERDSYIIFQHRRNNFAERRIEKGCSTFCRIRYDAVVYSLLYHWLLHHARNLSSIEMISRYSEEYDTLRLYMFYYITSFG